MSVNKFINGQLVKLSGGGGSIATTNTPGIVKPDGTTITIDANGTISADSGHTIVDESGVSLPKRGSIKFVNATVSDDAQNDMTVVEVEGGGTTIVQKPTVNVGTYTYNGSAQGPTITWVQGMADNCVITNATKTDAGSYTLTIALKNTSTMVWNDLTTADMTYNYTISKATLTVPAVTNTSKTYNGSTQSPTITGFDSDTMTKSGDSATNAGDYTVTFGLVDSDNYEWGSSTTSFAWSIAKANQMITLSSNSVTLDPTHLTATVTVSGAEGVISVSSSDSTIATASVSGSTVTISNVNQANGSATITVSVGGTSNYNAATDSSIAVSAAFLIIVTWANGTDEEIAAMVSAAADGKINIEDYWNVGDERIVTLASPVSETVTFVIEDLNNQTSGGTNYVAAVGQKNGLSTKKSMKNNDDYTGGYNATVLKTFLEGDYQTALQNATVGKFWSSIISGNHKEQTVDNSLITTASVKVILHSIFEFISNDANNYHSVTYVPYMADETTQAGFHQFEYYKTATNLIKKQGDNGNAINTWTRSVFNASVDPNRFFTLNYKGKGDASKTSWTEGVAPFVILGKNS